MAIIPLSLIDLSNIRSQVEPEVAHFHLLPLLLTVIADPDFWEWLISNAGPMEPLPLTKDIFALDHLALGESSAIAVPGLSPIIEPLFVIFSSLELLDELAIVLHLLLLESVLPLVALLVRDVRVFAQLGPQPVQLRLQLLARLGNELVQLLWHFYFLDCHPIAEHLLLYDFLIVLLNRFGVHLAFLLILDLINEILLHLTQLFL